MFLKLSRDLQPLPGLRRARLRPNPPKTLTAKRQEFNLLLFSEPNLAQGLGFVTHFFAFMLTVVDNFSVDKFVTQILCFSPHFRLGNSGAVRRETLGGGPGDDPSGGRYDERVFFLRRSG